MNNENTTVLEIKNLDVEYKVYEERVQALRNVNLVLHSKETLGVVGESGCGKSTLAFTIMNYLGPNGFARGEILFEGKNIIALSDREMNRYRGAKIAIVNQNPFTSLNPSLKLGDQLAEVGRFHRGMDKKQALQLAEEILTILNIPSVKKILKRYPHQISGGMQQRVCIAMGLLCQPDVLIMDEPTTALDVTTEVVILDMVNNLRNEFDTAIIYISHDLGVISSIADRIAVMYRGEVVEIADKDDIFRNPLHPYTEALIRCIPRQGVTKHQRALATIPGYIKSRDGSDLSCPFRDRCSRKTGPDCEKNYDFKEIESGHWASCTRAGGGSPIEEDGVIADVPLPPPEKVDLLRVENLKKYFGAGKKVYRAVDDISFYLKRNRVLGIVGESGCGKSTTALCIEGLVDITNGKIFYEEKDITHPWQKRNKDILKDIQMVFQDPARSLNPSDTVEQIIGRPIQVLRGIKDRNERRDKVLNILNKVGLNKDYLRKKPHQMSGGEKQRVAVARVFAVKPDLVICDEPTSALDVSVQAAVLNLLIDLQTESEKISYIFISHDLHVVNYVSDFVIVMYLGKIAEFGRTAEIFKPPYHPYTEALLSAIPEVGTGNKNTMIRLEGSVPVPDGSITGCNFHTRCPRKVGEICERQVPPKVMFSSTHYLNCHLPKEELAGMESVF